jgi:hypothetical protein
VDYEIMLARAQFQKILIEHQFRAWKGNGPRLRKTGDDGDGLKLPVNRFQSFSDFSAGQLLQKHAGGAGPGAGFGLSVGIEK